MTSRQHNSDALVTWLSTVGEGGRNNALFWACCRVVEAGGESLADLQVLVDTSVSNGLTVTEAENTAKSALRRYLGAVA